MAGDALDANIASCANDSSADVLLKKLHQGMWGVVCGFCWVHLVALYWGRGGKEPCPVHYHLSIIVPQETVGEKSFLKEELTAKEQLNCYPRK